MSLTQSVSDPLHASARDAYLVLSNDLELPVNSRESKITGWLVMKFFVVRERNGCQTLNSEFLNWNAELDNLLLNRDAAPSITGFGRTGPPCPIASTTHNQTSPPPSQLPDFGRSFISALRPLLGPDPANSNVPTER